MWENVFRGVNVHMCVSVCVFRAKYKGTHRLNGVFEVFELSVGWYIHAQDEYFGFLEKRPFYACAMKDKETKKKSKRARERENDRVREREGLR